MADIQYLEGVDGARGWEVHAGSDSSHPSQRVPHNARLERPLEPGQTVTIKGTVPLYEKEQEDETKSFSINFKHGSETNAPVALHLSIRFGDHEIIMNTKDNGEWGDEKKAKNPWKAGDNFDVRVRAHDDHFQVFADRKVVAKFEHRMPLSRVDHIYVDGEALVLHSVHWGGRYYSMPYESGVQGGIGVGRRLYMSGYPELEKKGADQWAINLVTRKGDVALTMSVRFDEKKVVRNSTVNGEWANEEVEGKFPFNKKEICDITIANEQYSFQIYVNGELFCTFAHRLPPNEIEGLKIQGELEVLSLFVK